MVGFPLEWLDGQDLHAFMSDSGHQGSSVDDAWHAQATMVVWSQ